MTSVILQAQARNRDYYRLIGYQEENGQLESTESYLTYIVAYIKMYAAMIQVCTIRFSHYCCMFALYLPLSGGECSYVSLCLVNWCIAVEQKHDCLTSFTDWNQRCTSSARLSRGMEVACNVPQCSPSYHSHCVCPSCFPQGKNALEDPQLLCACC